MILKILIIVFVDKIENENLCDFECKLNHCYELDILNSLQIQPLRKKAP